ALVAGDFGKLIKCFGDEIVVIALFGEPIFQDFFFDVAIAFSLLPIAEIAVVQLLLKEFDHPVLSFAFYLADLAHTVLFLNFSRQVFKASKSFLSSGSPGTWTGNSADWLCSNFEYLVINSSRN